mgnify:FL=1
MASMRSMTLWTTILAVLGSAARAVEPVPAPQAAPIGLRQAYRLGAGDKLRIVTVGEDKLSGEFQVSGDGLIAFPLLGDVRVDGQTASELAAAITERLGTEYLRDPRVSIQIISFRPIYILGEVARPGEYPFTEGMTIYSAVAKAGGFSYRANSKRAYIRHERDPSEKLTKVHSGSPVMPGDTIRIPQSYF